MFFELLAAEYLSAIFALVVGVLACRVASLLTIGAYEVSILRLMCLGKVRAPARGLEYVFACATPVAVAGQTLFPDMLTLHTSLAW